MFDDAFLRGTLERAFESPDYYNMPRGIKRFDYGNAHGWWVRVRRDRTSFRKLFSDGEYGGIQEAFKESIIYRHEILSNLPVTLKQIHGRSLSLEPEKRIDRITEKGRKQPYIFWQAKWYDENFKIQRKCFSVREFGDDEARLLALDCARKNHNKKPKVSSHPDLYTVPKFIPIFRSEVEVLASISSGSKSSTSGSGSNRSKLNICEDPHAFEGERKLELHKSIERDKNLRNQKINQFLSTHDNIHCELCKFNFKENYPFLSKDIIEVHHITPLSKLSSKTITKLNDLMLLCSNCHFAIHQGDPEENLIEAMELFENKNC
jgi:predicted HNH restriction endonuclease